MLGYFFKKGKGQFFPDFETKFVCFADFLFWVEY